MWTLNFLPSTIATISITLLPTHTESKPMQPCTPSIEPGITVTLSDARTGSPLDGRVVIQEKTFQETLRIQGATPSGQTIYGGAFERPGLYTLTASKSGYQTAILKNVRVEKDTCHVKTRQLSIRLQRQ